MDFQPTDTVWSYVPPHPQAKTREGIWMQTPVGMHMDDGGMARIYKMPPWPASRTLIKLFKPGLPDRERQICFTKIRAMSRYYPNLRSELPVVAWPKSMVFSSQHEAPANLIGCTIPFFSNPTALQLVASSLRAVRRFIPKADMDTMRTVAFNIIKGFEAIHARDVLFADPNANNILVDTSTLAVKFIDADSYAMSLPRRENGAVAFDFYGPSGTTQGFRSPYAIRCDRSKTPIAKYSAADDAYVLAIHLFTLLVPGFHPWHFSQSNHQQCESDALNGRFEYAGPHKSLPPCEQLRMFEEIPQNIRDAFVATFAHKTPPSASRWKELFLQNWRSL